MRNLIFVIILTLPSMFLSQKKKIKTEPIYCIGFPYRIGCTNDDIKVIQRCLGILPYNGILNTSLIKELSDLGYSEITTTKLLTEEIYSQIIGNCEKSKEYKDKKNETSLIDKTIVETPDIKRNSSHSYVENMTTWEFDSYQLIYDNVEMKPKKLLTKFIISDDTSTIIMIKGKQKTILKRTSDWEPLCKWCKMDDSNRTCQILYNGKYSDLNLHNSVREKDGKIFKSIYIMSSQDGTKNIFYNEN